MVMSKLKRRVIFTEQASTELDTLRPDEQRAVLHNVGLVANDQNPYTRLRKLKNDAGWNLRAGRIRVWIIQDDNGQLCVTRVERRSRAYRRGS
ncbi:MAG: hypothetical protein AAF653_17615 [Chloroflexota bacterium]